MRLRRSLLAGLLCVTSFAPAPSVAARNCRRTCRERVEGCRRVECAGLQGAARRVCTEQCKGAAGCPAHIRTLAWVQSECRLDAHGNLTAQQSLRIRRRDCDPITVMRVPAGESVQDPIGVCSLFGLVRWGDNSMVAGAFQRLGVSPDGRRVVFEVTNSFALLPLTRLSPDEEGMFSVRSDGRDLRRLGPASREPGFRVVFDPSIRYGIRTSTYSQISFSPDGRTIAFPDTGPDPTGKETTQIVAVDLVSGRRTQVTHLSPASPPDPLSPVTCCPAFFDAETIRFQTYAHPLGSDSANGLASFTVKTDGTGLRVLPAPVALPESRVVPDFRITAAGQLVGLTLPGTPANSFPDLGTAGMTISEAFRFRSGELLQLTNFRRVDTYGLFLSRDRGRAFLQASADPFGTNPSANCQFFSVDTLGGRLRQLTHFAEGAHSQGGCFQYPPPGCALGNAFLDPVTETIVFGSSCNPLGTNPNGGQLFAMRPDGSRIRQLTDARGVVTDPDGSLLVELPGPFAYSRADL